MVYDLIAAISRKYVLTLDLKDPYSVFVITNVT